MKKCAERTPLGSPKNAMELLDLYFLDMRCALLETAATFDRIERAPGAAEALADPRIENLRKACGIIRDRAGDRAESFLMLFSERGGGGKGDA